MRYHYNFSYIIICVTVFITVLHLTGLVYAQVQGWPLQPDSANIAILKFDYQTYAFEGAAYSNYAPCLDCDPDSLPWEIIYHVPGDFGDITFQYLPTMDSLFFATIIWMGQGEIFIPETFQPAESFYYWDSVSFAPDTIYHFLEDTWGGSWWAEEADSLWSSIQALGLYNLQQFTQNKTQVGLYLYPPSVGMFDPNPAKWIAFFYQDLTREPDYDTTSALSFFPLVTGNSWQYFGHTFPDNQNTWYDLIEVGEDTILDNGNKYFHILDYGIWANDAYLRIDTASLQVMQYNTGEWTECIESEFSLYDLSQIINTDEYSFCNGYTANAEIGVENYGIIPGNQPAIAYNWFYNGLGWEHSLVRGIGPTNMMFEENGGSSIHLIAATINDIQYGEYYIAPTSYFPNQINQFWSYSDLVDTFTVQVEDSISMNNNTYYTFNNYRPNDFAEFSFRVEENQVFALNNDTAYVMYDFAADSGDSWDLIAAGMPSTMFLLNINETVSTPAGEFENCFVFNHIFGMDYEYIEWFAPDVGLVQRDDITFAGLHRWQLTDYGQLSIINYPVIPNSYLLHQNYPNPFNPVTTIRYELPEQTHVKLTVFDLTGREISILADGVQMPGVREVQFDAGELASGIYFYRLTTKHLSSPGILRRADQLTRKMVAIK